MPINNNFIAETLNQYADLLAIKGSNPFKIRAYRSAARKIGNIPRQLSDMIKNDENLQQFSGIGEGIAEKIAEIVETGQLHQLEEIKEEVPKELLEVLKLDGLGPERVQDLYQKLNIQNMEDLDKALNSQEIRKLEGFGPKTEANIRNSIEKKKRLGDRLLYNKVEEYIRPLIEYMEDCEIIHQLSLAGSFRRRKETIGDIDLLATGGEHKAIRNYYLAYEDIVDVISKGETKSTVKLRGGLQVDLRIVDQENYGAALVYFTGSKDHNIRLRHLAREQGKKINEYGVYIEETGESMGGATEEEVYNAIDLPYIIPELREDRGEIEAAQQNNLPNLIEQDDMKGDLQMHSTYSDGSSSIEDMAEAAQKLGYEYIAITDHSQRVTIANGLKEEEVLKEIEEIDDLNKQFDDFKILKAIEVDILEDGTLDYSKELLDKLDLRVCCVHYKFDLPHEKQMERIMRAMENPYFDIFGHPTARRLNDREPIDIDMEKVIDKAIEENCYIELNASPERLDINDIYCKRAKEKGLKIVISTDAHGPNQLQNMKYGINQARRGWLSPKDVLNTRSLNDFLKHL